MRRLVRLIADIASPTRMFHLISPHAFHHIRTPTPDRSPLVAPAIPRARQTIALFILVTLILHPSIAATTDPSQRSDILVDGGIEAFRDGWRRYHGIVRRG